MCSILGPCHRQGFLYPQHPFFIPSGMMFDIALPFFIALFDCCVVRLVVSPLVRPSLPTLLAPSFLVPYTYPPPSPPCPIDVANTEKAAMMTPRPPLHIMNRFCRIFFLLDKNCELCACNVRGAPILCV